jgi:predicted O-methyltransferase YrrM
VPKGFIDIVPAESLHDRLKLPPTDPSLESSFKPLNEWSPTDDAPILRYLFRYLRPERLIELGTGRDASHVWCLEECQATIWRTRPPRDAHDIASPVVAGNGLGHRVWQRLGDGAEWDGSAFAPGFFDSALINGSATADRVSADTRMALSLVRSGGLIIWRDFCPDPALFDVFDLSAAVVPTVIGNWKEFKASLADAFWVRPSLLLVAFRR